MTTNQMIVLLDVHRGFSRPGHTATLNADLGQLERKGMIAMGVTDGFEYVLTKKGIRMVLALKAVADVLEA